MRWRRLFYMIPLFIMAIMLGKEFLEDNNNKILLKTETEVMQDFRDSRNIQNVPRTESGADYYVTGLYFPPNYSGISGDAFYVGWGNGSKRLTQHYVLKVSEPEHDHLDFVLKDTWEDYLPPADKFTFYSFDK